MEFSFNCPFCNLELSIDESGAGQEIECPNCKEMLIIPTPPQAAGGASPSERGGPLIPEGSFPDAHIIKPTARPLEIAFKASKTLKIRTFRHHEHLIDGKDGFDEAVSKFLAKHPEEDISSVRSIQFTQQTKSKDAEGKESTESIIDYGVIVFYRA